MTEYLEKAISELSAEDVRERLVHLQAEVRLLRELSGSQGWKALAGYLDSNARTIENRVLNNPLVNNLASGEQEFHKGTAKGLRAALTLSETLIGDFLDEIRKLSEFLEDGDDDSTRSTDDDDDSDSDDGAFNDDSDADADRVP